MKQRKDKTSYHHGNLRAALVAEARRLVVERGARALSLREVARRLGFSQTAPYRHFGSRDALLAAVATEAFREFGAAVAGTGAPPADPAARLLRLGRGYVAFATRNPELLRLMFGPECADKAAYPELQEAAAATHRQLAEGVGLALAQSGAPEVDPGVAAFAVWSIAHGLANLIIDQPMPPSQRAQSERDGFVDQVLSVIYRGLAPRG
jgi:AcrR family transcriptional regulator